MFLRFILTVFLCFFWQSTSSANESNFTFSLESEYGAYKSPKRSYLGTTPTVTGPFTYDLVRPDNDAILRALSLSLENKVPSASDLIFLTSFQTGRATQTDKIGFIDLGGENLIIGGARAGQSFLLQDGGVGATANISNAQYKFDYQFYEINTKIAAVKDIKNSPIIFKPFIGLSYRYSNLEDRFKGDVLDFNRSFSNDTNIRVQTLSPMIGTNINFPITSKLTFLNSINYGYNFNWGRGSDKVAFTTQTTQTEKMKNNNGTHSYGVSTGFDYKINDEFSFGFKGQYQRSGNAPKSQLRDNSQESDFDYESADIFSGSLNLTYKF